MAQIFKGKLEIELVGLSDQIREIEAINPLVEVIAVNGKTLRKISPAMEDSLYGENVRLLLNVCADTSSQADDMLDEIAHHIGANLED